MEEECSKLNQVVDHVEDTAKEVSAIIEHIVTVRTKELDEYMKFVKEMITDTNNPPTTEELDECILTIPTYLYFVSDSQEELGIREDIAKALKQEIYNSAYESAAGQVSARKAVAETESQLEALSQQIYSRAYKKVKARTEAALEVLNSAKKIVTRRIAELEATKNDSGASRGGKRR